MRLFANELCKIKASRSVKWITIVFFCFAVLAGAVWKKGANPVEIYGFCGFSAAARQGSFCMPLSWRACLPVNLNQA